MSEFEPVLISHHLCPYVQRAVIALTEKNIRHRRIYVDLSRKPDWFRRISPLGKVPLLKVGETVLFESAVICEYLDETTPGSLHPAQPVARAHHRAWIELASATLNAIAALYNAPDAVEFDRRCEALRERFRWLERQVSATPFFAGQRFQMVDAAWAPVFRYLDTFDRIGDFDLIQGLENVQRYRRALARRASVQSAVSEDYPERLRAFLARRNSHMAAMLAEEA